MDEGCIIFRAKNEFRGTDYSKEIVRYISTYPRVKCKFGDVVYDKKLNRYTVKLMYNKNDAKHVSILIENCFLFKFWIKRLEQ